MDDSVWISFGKTRTERAAHEQFISGTVRSKYQVQIFLFRPSHPPGLRPVPIFSPAGVVKLLRSPGFTHLSNGIMRILTDQLNAHIEKVARNRDIPVHWRPSQGGGKNGAKSNFVDDKYAKAFTGKGNHIYYILTDKEPVRTFVCRELKSKNGKPYERIYDCRKPVKQYYIYFHD